MLEERLKLQQEIMQKHSSSKALALLKKYSHTTQGSSGFLHFASFSSSYGMVGLYNSDCYDFLPHFEYNVNADYVIDVPEKLAPQDGMRINRSENGQEVALKTKDGKETIHVTFTAPKDLFQLRNLASQGNLLSLLQTEDSSKLPFEESQIKAGFYFRISSASFGQYVAKMPINNPNAEEIIEEFLKTIDERFKDYSSLAHYWKEGTELSGYRSEERKVQKALFNKVKKVLKQNGIKYQGYCRHSLWGKILGLLP